MWGDYLFSAYDSNIDSYADQPQEEFKDQVVTFGPVSKTVKGGRRRSFRALVVVGNGKGKVGAGMGKAQDLTDAIRKGIEDAKKNLIEVPMNGTTIPHEVMGEFGAGKVLLKPASPGTGIIAGRGVRPVMELAGIEDVLTKSLGSSNPYNVVYATIEALKNLRSAREIAELRGLTRRREKGEESEVV
ncbi:MAG TPA: 30S ribosomal protein S5 [Firmicutes bacterium]|nr:30S ribosomal protein S5 [Candidatus Fermentithermobacillaceae bacterium]